MRVAVASTGEGLDAAIDPRFGRCACFVVVDTETMKATTIPNPGASTAQGAGIQAAQSVANADVDAVIATNFGPNAHQALAAGEMALYSASGGSVRDAVDALQRGELKRVTAASVPAHFGMGQGGGMGRGGGRGGRW
ncbi:MAG TPA: NifB/NifX family molybdenum-iron cluster-binding protein [Armatimonadota bacterium]|nr:NifB/NifX family molybdenum-iron cluster-binding protein [Armatimonadota bacterium]HOM81320.1 NifB/NifX family molybdenum-iron cluster-binding protein [Armatimonadota bacterium]HPO72706.1 NifB/NifX family molybdenum-iron cluster-binding protein [Armatimonadota bacterium]